MLIKVRKSRMDLYLNFLSDFSGSEMTRKILESPKYALVYVYLACCPAGYVNTFPFPGYVDIPVVGHKIEFLHKKKQLLIEFMCPSTYCQVQCHQTLFTKRGTQYIFGTVNRHLQNTQPYGYLEPLESDIQRYKESRNFKTLYTLWARGFPARNWTVHPLFDRNVLQVIDSFL
jgi:hypothetical protein